MEQGEFILQENSFIFQGKKFCIRERKKQTKKPKYYLIQLEPFLYISSLFPVPGTTKEYTFDFNNELFHLKLNECLAEVHAL